MCSSTRSVVNGWLAEEDEAQERSACPGALNRSHMPSSLKTPSGALLSTGGGGVGVSASVLGTKSEEETMSDVKVGRPFNRRGGEA